MVFYLFISLKKIENFISILGIFSKGIYRFAIVKPIVQCFFETHGRLLLCGGHSPTVLTHMKLMLALFVTGIVPVSRGSPILWKSRICQEDPWLKLVDLLPQSRLILITAIRWRKPA